MKRRRNRGKKRSATKPAFRHERLEDKQLLTADAGAVLGMEMSTEFETASLIASNLSAGQTSEQSPDQSTPTRRRDNDGTLVTVDTTEVRSYDGSNNNLENPEFGTAGSQLLRVAEAAYADGVSELAGANRPSAREISNALAAQDPDAAGNERQLSAFVYVWGQFLDHDIDLTESGHTELANIEVPIGDERFDPEGTGEEVLLFARSVYDASTGDSLDNPREQINLITSWIDGSVVYGSDQATADSLRAFVGGRMLTSDGDLLPRDESGFLAGDVRANENVQLTSLQTLFVREHNRLAAEIAAADPSLSDEEIFQQARAIVVAEIQAITYNEFLPALLGVDALPEYAGYDPTVDPSIANEFSTAAYRLGHSLLNDDVEFFGNDGRAVFDEVSLAEAFFNPDLLAETGIDSLLKYAASSQSQEVDTRIVDSVRNFLFVTPGATTGLDLAALNIQRGRDHGLADYNSVREAYGLERVESFADITSDVELQQTLEDLYGSVDDIDLWVGALAEDHVAGASVGETTMAIVVDQFTRLRDGDRFWYENTLSDRDVRRIDRTTLSAVIQRNTGVSNLQDNVFFMSATVSGVVSAAGPRGDRGVSGVTVELLDDEGEVIDTTTTDARGRYVFTDFRETGDYEVRVLRPTRSGTVEEVADVLVSRGGLAISNVDFGGGDVGDKPPGGRRDRGPAPRDRIAATDRALESEPLSSDLTTLAEELARSRGRRRSV